MSEQKIKVGDRVKVAGGRTHEVVAILEPFAWVRPIDDSDSPRTVHVSNLTVVDNFPVGSLVSQIGDKMRIRYEVVQKYTHHDGLKYSIVVDSCGPVLLKDDELELYA